MLKQDGTVWTTGENKYGQLGDGSTLAKSSFVQVLSSGAKAIAAGYDHSMVLKQDGSVWTTGDNKYGQLGDGSTLAESSFVQVISSWAKAIAAGYDHSMVLKQDGSVWTTGNNNFGQLGNGRTFRNTFGQLGNGPRTFRSTFAQVTSSGMQAVAAGGWHSMVLSKDGIVWATGTNAYGQLGDGSMIAKNIYVRVLLSRDGAWCTVLCMSRICSIYFSVDLFN